MSNSTAEKAGMKEKIVHEVRKLIVNFIYLSVFFTVCASSS
jgi:hypothetical protein